MVYQYSAAPWTTGQTANDYIPSARAWTWDIHYDAEKNPRCVFQVQRDNVTGSGWNHDRIYYYYARWTGTTWQKRFIAHAGRGLYSSEDDYGDGISIDPDNTNVVYFSSNAANPFNLGDLDNVPLAPSERYELYRGVTADGGLTFTWEKLTNNSPRDNLRPIIPENHGYDRTLLWFYGTYSSYTNYTTKVLALLQNDLQIKSSSFVGQTSGTLSWDSSPGLRYRITGSADLNSFPYTCTSGIESQGPTTSKTFSFPPQLQGAPKAFFRVETE